MLTGGVTQRRRLALLALLATSSGELVTRDKLLALLWPKHDYQIGRSLLNQSVYVLRKALGNRAIDSEGDELPRDLEVVYCDIVAFEQALTDGDDERAIVLYSGPFLDGFLHSEALVFQCWIERLQERLAGEYAEALRRLAEAAEACGRVRAVVGDHSELAEAPYEMLSHSF